VHVGDRVLAIDGVETRDKSAAEASSLISSNRTSHVRLHLLPASAVALLRQRRLASNGLYLLIY